MTSLISEELGTYQVSPSRLDLPVSRRPDGLRCFSFPRIFCKLRVHPRIRFTFSLEYVSARCLPSTRTHPAPSLRFHSPSRHQPEEATCGEFPTAHLVTPPAFHPLTTFFSASGLVGLFHPTAASEIRFSRVFPPDQPHDSSPCHAFLTLASFACCTEMQRQLRSLRLQGLAPVRNPSRQRWV